MNSKKWYVYMIENAKGHLYTGITTDPERRLHEHFSGVKGAKFFHSAQAKQMVYLELAANRSEASKRESAIKKMDRSTKLALIEAQK